MKSPAELKMRLRRQWKHAATRETRLLGGPEAWPIVLSVGRPKPKVMAGDFDSVKRHVQRWRSVSIGEVCWERINYRATAAPVEMPLYWKINQPSEWIAASADRPMREEFDAMSAFVEHSEPCFHPKLIRRRSLWRDKPQSEVLQATRLASALAPCCAEGRPLRTLSLEGVDTKFFERNSRLMTHLLDARFDGEPSRIGLETFLGAVSEGDHWLLVADLDGSLLPFRRQRVSSAELAETPLSAKRLLIVENETCLHQLPYVPETIAILGAGFDLSWTEAHWLRDKQIGYWGDIDTWGLQFLATARESLPHLDALMMSSETFDQNLNAAVAEPVVAGTDVPQMLAPSERSLYKRLLNEPRGRLEQEFLPAFYVHVALTNWHEQSRDT